MQTAFFNCFGKRKRRESFLFKHMIRVERDEIMSRFAGDPDNVINAL